MTAREYYEAYSAYVMSSITTKDYFELMFEAFNSEIQSRIVDMNLSRHHFYESSAKIIREVNDKWNALVRLFEKRNPERPCKLVRDEVKTYWLKIAPELKAVNIGRDWP